MELMLLSVLSPAVQCQWELTNSEKATITSVSRLGNWKTLKAGTNGNGKWEQERPLCAHAHSTSSFKDGQLENAEGLTLACCRLTGVACMLEGLASYSYTPEEFGTECNVM